MSLAVCLSLVANLRCSGLTPQQSRGILIPPAVEAVFISFLIYTERNKGRKHFLLLFDSYIFLSLCILDFISKANDAISTSITIFPIVDRVIGGVSGFSIVFYTLFLYLFARRHFILILPPRFQWSIKVLLTVLIPVILVLVELGSLLGYTYVTLPPSSELAVRFNTSLAKTLWTLLNSAGLVLLVLYQFVNFCLSIFRIFRYFYHSSSPNSPALEAKGKRSNTREPVRIRGIGWIAAGIKLGAIEVLLGFVPNGFGMSLSRRLFRLVGRLMLAWGVYQGIDESPGSTMFRVGSIDSIEGLPPRRIPVNPAALRTLIGAPMSDTFAKMSPTATAFHTRKKVPDAMAGVRAFDVSFVDEKSGRIGEPSKLRDVVPSGPITVRNLVVPSGGSPNPYGFGRASANYGKPGVDAGKLYPERPTFPKLKQAEKRVTVAYDGLQAPVLDIRFSSQIFPDAGKLIGRLGKHSPSGSTDHSSERPALSRSQTAPAPAVAPRARSMPPAKLKTASKEDSQSSQSSLPATTQSVSPPLSTQDSKPKELLPMSRTANNGTRGRSRSASTKSVPTLYNPFADPPNLVHSNSQETTTSSASGRKRTNSSVSEDSLSAIRQLSMKFPPLPSGASPTRTGDASFKMLPRKRVPDETSGPNASERPSVRQRSYSSPRLQSENKVESDPFRNLRPETSPRTSLDRDVAIRTRRRLPPHLQHLSGTSTIRPGDVEGPSSGKWSGHNSNQCASGSPNATTVNSTATSLFSTPIVGKHHQNSKSIGGGKTDNMEDILASPITDFSRDT
ncbi:hypothetical protein M408DRAFT_112004 [Serendipita vermifera MAFF 305830]|uniref:Uncharacterized protein n=1 Tax=Serendipita vermifera MAFF 305830 TaxID=933852 RepID=A0A0C3ALY8_SERVB|nr:hypothetical protein M408DRAFT_112004 [Serendipita vermifera MAFF 305830]